MSNKKPKEPKLPPIQQLAGSANTEIVVDAELDVRPALQLDDDVQKMLLKNDLLPYFTKLNSKICRIYKNITMVKHRLMDDVDIPEKQSLIFEIHLSGDPVQILQDEKRMHTVLFSQVPKEKQHLFLFTYRIP